MRSVTTHTYAEPENSAWQRFCFGVFFLQLMREWGPKYHYQRAIIGQQANSYVVVHVFICICTCLAMFTSFYVCLDCRRRVVTKVVRTCDPTPLLYKNVAIKYV